VIAFSEDFDEQENFEPTPLLPEPEPTIDPRAFTTPHAIENEIVIPAEDAKWIASEEAKFRERNFRLYYERSFALEKNATMRFAKALAASCRSVRNVAMLHQAKSSSNPSPVATTPRVGGDNSTEPLDHKRENKNV
jgi:hypothetical protein